MLQGERKRPRIQEPDNEYGINDDDELLETELINRLLQDEGISDELLFSGNNNNITEPNHNLKSRMMNTIKEITDDEYAVVDIDEDTLNEFDLQATQLLMKPRDNSQNISVPIQPIQKIQSILPYTTQLHRIQTQNSQKKSYFANFNKSQKPDLNLQLEQVF